MSGYSNISHLPGDLIDLINEVDDSNNSIDLSNNELLSLLGEPNEPILDISFAEGVIENFLNIEIEDLEELTQQQQQQPQILAIFMKENISGLANLSNIDDIEPMQL